MPDWSDAPGCRVRINDKSLEYACFGPPPAQAPTLVLLHEGLGSVGLWRDFPQAVSNATGMGVLVWSRAGYGRSDTITLPRNRDYMTEEATAGLGPLLDAFDIRQAVLLGHSDGASISVIYAGSVSDMRVRGLVLLAPHFFVERVGLDAIRTAGEAFTTGDLRQRLARHHDDPEAAFMGWHDVWTSSEYRNWDICDCIDHLRVPVLAVQCRDDPYGTLAQIHEVETRMYAPVETLILEGCGHSPYLEAQAACLEAVRDFCGRLNRLEAVRVATG
ncbi:alpha/beta hydrolase [uncultured Roseobacter sp.]|uniref:alpha/beta fold hydrolase n=1 Tax=uncultured Roseobacter sp. TaxID=114847 RepID=UPI0026138D95|nr:alpha/beta hydrolase [uncultured Roseobacter sp.]